MGSGILNGGAAVEGTSERDLGPEGTQTPENEKTRVSYSTARVEAVERAADFHICDCATESEGVRWFLMSKAT